MAQHAITINEQPQHEPSDTEHGSPWSEDRHSHLSSPAAQPELSRGRAIAIVAIAVAALVLVSIFAIVRGGDAEITAASDQSPTTGHTLWKDKDNDGDGIPNGEDDTINGESATWTPTPVPPAPAPAPAKDEYPAISDRDWALLVKNPVASVGRRVVIYAQVTQFDAATGTTMFRANGFSAPQTYYWDGDNIMVNGSAGLLAGVVQDDILKIYATAEGPLTYETQIGGSTTVPEFTADYIDIIGHDS